jgi:hypothetical protein
MSPRSCPSLSRLLPRLILCSSRWGEFCKVPVPRHKIVTRPLRIVHGSCCLSRRDGLLKIDIANCHVRRRPGRGSRVGKHTVGHGSQHEQLLGMSGWEGAPAWYRHTAVDGRDQVCRVWRRTGGYGKCKMANSARLYVGRCEKNVCLVGYLQSTYSDGKGVRSCNLFGACRGAFEVVVESLCLYFVIRTARSKTPSASPKPDLDLDTSPTHLTVLRISRKKRRLENLLPIPISYCTPRAIRDSQMPILQASPQPLPPSSSRAQLRRVRFRSIFIFTFVFYLVPIADSGNSLLPPAWIPLRSPLHTNAPPARISARQSAYLTLPSPVSHLGLCKPLSAPGNPARMQYVIPKFDFHRLTPSGPRAQNSHIHGKIPEPVAPIPNAYHATLPGPHQPISPGDHPSATLLSGNIASLRGGPAAGNERGSAYVMLDYYTLLLKYGVTGARCPDKLQARRGAPRQR